MSIFSCLGIVFAFFLFEVQIVLRKNLQNHEVTRTISVLHVFTIVVAWMACVLAGIDSAKTQFVLNTLSVRMIVFALYGLVSAMVQRNQSKGYVSPDHNAE